MDLHRIDSHKLSLHPHRVAQWLDARGEWERAKHVYPLYVEVSPVGACNHRCTFCAVDYIGYKAVTLDGPLLRLRLAEMARLGIKSVMFAGEGEPLLHKEINATVIASKGAGLDVSFTTNGVLLNKLDLGAVSWVKVSVNAGTRETYARVHRTKEKDWDTVWANLADAVKRKGRCELMVQMVCLPENAGEEKEIQARAESIGLDGVVFKPYSQHKSSITRRYDGYKPVNLPASTRTIVRENAIATEGHNYEKCNATPNFWAYIMASGDVYSCSAYLLDERFNLGSIKSKTFAEVWEGERRRENWALMQNLDITECRVNCRMTRANEYLADFDRVKGINFV